MTLSPLPATRFTGVDLRERVNAALIEARAARRFPTVAVLLADTSMAYDAGARAVAAGDVIEAGGHRYEAAAPTATDHHRTTAGGVKLYHLPLWAQPDVLTGHDLPWLSVGPSDVARPKNHVFVRQETADRTDATTLQVQRVVTTDDGHTNPKAIRALTSISAGGGDQIEWAISGEVTNSDDTRVAAEGGTAVSGVALKQAANTGTMFGGHFQVKDETGLATVGGIVGVECNIQGNGPDTNGNRIGIDLIARTYGAGDAGEFTAGLRIRNSASGSGKWTTALLIQDGAQATPTAIAIQNSPGTAVGAALTDTGSKANGIILGGTYGGSALRLNAGSYIAMEATGGVKTAFGVAANVWGFYNGASERVGFDMTATPKVRVGGLGVVGARRTGWAAATGTATRTAFDTATATTAQLAERVKALLDDLTTHGLIGA